MSIYRYKDYKFFFVVVSLSGSGSGSLLSIGY